MAEYTAIDFFEKFNVPEQNRKSAIARMSQLLRGRTTTSKKDQQYTYLPELVEGVHYRRSGRAVLYSEAGVKKLRELLQGVME